jgi:hypothetical protein
MPKADVRVTVEKKYPEFVEDIEKFNVDELESRLVYLAKEKEKVLEAKKLAEENMADGALGNLKYQVSLIEGPINDAKKAIDLKTSYIIKMIEERGGNVDVDVESEEE